MRSRRTLFGPSAGTGSRRVWSGSAVGFGHGGSPHLQELSTDHGQGAVSQENDRRVLVTIGLFALALVVIAILIILGNP